MEILIISLMAAIGPFFVFLRLSWKARLHLLGWALVVDIVMFLLLFYIHKGSFGGAAVATGGGVACSVLLWVLKTLFGSISSGVYHPGLIDVSKRIK